MFYHVGMERGTGETEVQAPIALRGGTERALAVLKELARHPSGTTLDELSRTLSTPKSSVHRALVALVKAGLAVRPEPGRYSLGTEFIRLAYTHQEGRVEPRLVEPCLRELADTLGETAHYAELEGHEVIYLAKVNPSHQSVQMTSRIGGRNPAFCTGVGKALLASRLAAAPDEETFLAGLGPLAARTAKTLADPAALIADLRATAERGYALDDEENERNVRCVGAAVLDERGRPIGPVSVSALTLDLALGDVPAIGARVAVAAHELSRVAR